MTRTIGSNLKTHFGLDTTSLCTIWKLTRTDSTVMGFTNLDSDVVYDGVTYKASTGFTASDINNKTDYSVSTQEIDAFLDSSSITEEDLFAGIYDYAEIVVSIINYNSIADGVVLIGRGWLGEIKFQNNSFSTEVRSLSEKLNKNIGQLYSPSCRVVLGDSRCGFNLASTIVSGDNATYTSVVVTSKTDNQRFYASSLSSKNEGLFTNGVLTWSSGLNNGLSTEIKDFIDGEITLVLPMPYTVSATDEFTVYVGCDKNFQTCKDKFNNVLNFRGEPHVPGTQEILKTGTTK